MEKNNIKSRQIQIIVCCMISIVLTIVRIAIFEKIPLWSLYPAPHDDTLLQNYAVSILNGEWLGKYNQYTLLKGISYSIWMVVCSKIHISYSLGLAILYIIAASSMASAIYRWSNRNLFLATIIYLGILYNPIGFATYVSARIYRMAIIAPVVVFIFAASFQVFIRIVNNEKGIMIWSILEGISLGFFWNIREDSIWIAPYILIFSVILIGYVMKRNAKLGEKIKKSIVLLIPEVCIAASMMLISIVNYMNYGIFVTNDRNQTGYSEMMSSILSIKSDMSEVPSDGDIYWLSRKTMNEIVDKSESLSSISDEIWYNWNEWDRDNDGESEGDFFSFAIRDAACDAGLYQTAKMADEFYATVNEELQQEINNGTFETNEGIRVSPLAKNILFDDLVSNAVNSFDRIITLAKYEQCDAYIPNEAESAKYLCEIPATNSSRLLSEKYIQIDGWVAVKGNNDISFELNSKKASIEYYERPDVESYLGSEYFCRGYRINTSVNDLSDLALQLTSENGVNNEIFVSDIVDALNNICTFDDVDMVAENLSYYFADGTDYYETDELMLRLNKITELFSTFGGVLFYCAIICWFIMLIHQIKTHFKIKEVNCGLLMSSGMFASVYVLVYGVLIFMWMGADSNLYLAAGYPMLFTIEILTIYMFWENIVKRIRIKIYWK